MSSIAEELVVRKSNLNEFKILTERILSHMQNTLTSYKNAAQYRIYSSTIAGTTKFIRPVNSKMFYFDPEDFNKGYERLKDLLAKLRRVGKSSLKEDELFIIDSVLYTIQQSLGIGMDLLLNSNSARKHIGNRFEELIKVIFDEIGIANNKSILKIPYETEAGTKIYKCENDLILSPHSEVKSTSSKLDDTEIVVSIKTTSKDRMGKIFIDKLLLEKFVGHKQKIIGIFLNDVQRKETDKISFTLVSGLFMVYSTFLTELEGVYYFDLPPNGYKEPFKKYMSTFSTLISSDIFDLLSS
ncbi:MAG: hypothetical protein AAGA77_13590 [Bacteroidota bacterium]